MKKRIVSSDPKKAGIIQEFKQVHGVDKVTDLIEYDDYYEARCFKHLGNRKYAFEGAKVVIKSGDI